MTTTNVGRKGRWLERFIKTLLVLALALSPSWAEASPSEADDIQPDGQECFTGGHPPPPTGRGAAPHISTAYNDYKYGEKSQLAALRIRTGKAGGESTEHADERSRTVS